MSDLHFERRLDHSVEKVWRAITDPAELRGWWAAFDRAPEPGGTVVVSWLNGDAVMTAAVTAYEPPRVLELDGDIHGRLRFELTPDGDGTTLRFDVDLSDEARAMEDKVQAGWHWHLDQLAAALAGDPFDWEQWDTVGMAQWEAIHAQYATAG
jgi:uncharacterized protein YndB with AHSA1/START domain